MATKIEQGAPADKGGRLRVFGSVEKKCLGRAHKYGDASILHVEFRDSALALTRAWADRADRRAKGGAPPLLDDAAIINWKRETSS